MKQETLEEFCNRELENFNGSDTRSTEFDLGFRTGTIIGLRFPKERSYSEKESFENKSLKWWMSLTMDEQVEIGFKYDMPTFNLTLRAIMHEFEQFKKK